MTIHTTDLLDFSDKLHIFDKAERVNKVSSSVLKYSDEVDVPIIRYKESFEVGCYFTDSIIVSGIGLLWHDDKIIINKDLMPSYWRNILFSNSYSNPEFDAILPIREINEPCICALGWGNNIYGHFIIEALPRILIGKKILHNRGVRPKLLLRNDASNWLLRILYEYLDFTELDIVFFDPYKERVRLLQGIYPGFCYYAEHGFHSNIIDLLSDIDIKDRLDFAPKSIFLSRQDISKLDPKKNFRVCNNEQKLCEIAEKEYGMSIIAPETLTWGEQISLFRNANSIVSLYCSALHTQLLASNNKQLKVGVCGYINSVQSDIAVLNHQPIYYQMKDFRVAERFSVPAEGFRSLLSHILA